MGLVVTPIVEGSVVGSQIVGILASSDSSCKVVAAFSMVSGHSCFREAWGIRVNSTVGKSLYAFWPKL